MSDRLEPVLIEAERLLVLPTGNGRDLWLWEHSLRVMRLAEMLATMPDLEAEQPDPTAAALAGLFYDAGWAIQARDGGLLPSQVLARPTSNIQRELAAGALIERCARRIEPEIASLAADAIRECNNRQTTMPEARVVSEAANLDEFGIMYAVRQLRQVHAEGRRIEDVLSSWNKQREYRYWEARLDGLRFGLSRDIARDRLNALADFMDALAREASGADVRKRLTPPPD